MIIGCYDLETTGLITNLAVKDKLNPEIVEFCLISYDGATNEINENYNSFVKPKSNIPEVITKITGISDETVKDAPGFSEIAEMLKYKLESCSAIVCHNASFDVTLTDIEMARYGLKVRWPRIICTLEATTHLLGRNLKMADLYEYLFQKEMGEAHKASIDTMNLVKITQKLFELGML